MDNYRDEAARPFYASRTWIACRKAYASSKAHLCERCLACGIIKRGEIVHHIQPLNSQNINNPAITLSWDNLMVLCRKCHGEVHADRRFVMDESGKVTAVDIGNDDKRV